MPRLCLSAEVRSACKLLLMAIAAIILIYFVMSPTQIEHTQAEVVIHTEESEDTLRFTVELAKTPEEQSRGLMHRTELDPNHGMLFLYDTPAELNFWMKNTLIPLDILFIDEAMRIHHIHSNAEPLSEARISSQGVVSSVLEINGGIAKERGIKVGDKVEIVP